MPWRLRVLAYWADFQGEFDRLIMSVNLEERCLKMPVAIGNGAGFILTQRLRMHLSESTRLICTPPET